MKMLPVDADDAENEAAPGTLALLLARYRRWREKRRNRYGKLITTPQDFPNVKVYQRIERGLPVFTIAFRNREVRYMEGFSGFLTFIFVWIPAFAVIVGWFWAALLALAVFASPETNVPFVLDGLLFRSESFEWFVWWPVLSVAVAPFITRYTLPYRRLRIVLDPVRDELRVMHGRRVRVRRPLRLVSTSVEEHVAGVIDRFNRQMSGDKKKGPGMFEKQHCLIGWFGLGGGERVELVSRFEWPNRMSLMEVQQALNWVANRALEGDHEQQIAGPEGRHILPPLD